MSGIETNNVVERLRHRIELHRAGEALSGYRVSAVEVPAADAETLLTELQSLSDRIDVQQMALERAAENFERLTVPHIVGHDVHNFAFQAAKAIRASLTQGGKNVG